MKFEKSKFEGLHFEYNVTLPAEDIEAAVTEKIKDKAKNFKMQGFRPGHVPFEIVRRNVENSVTADVLNSLISQACGEVVDDAKVEELATKPVYKFNEPYGKGKDVVLTVYFDAVPFFKLEPYDFEIEKVIPEVTDKDVDEARKNLMTNAPVREEASKDYAIQPGDEVSYHATCYNNGVESKKKSFSNKVAIPSSIPEGAEFLVGFVGKKIGDAFDFVPATEKNLKYKVEVRSVNKALSDILPEEYAKRAGFKDLATLNGALKERLEKEINDAAFVYHKYQVLDKLANEYKFELPESVLEQEMRFTLTRAKKEQEQKRKVDPKVELESDEELRKGLKEIVRKRCMLGYVLNRIAKNERISVSDDETTRCIYEDIRRAPNDAGALLKFYKNNPDAYAYRKATILEQKVVEFLIGKIKGKEVKKTRAEIDKVVSKLLEV